MSFRGRRAIPDNLDPLVDTLSNVVGILVIVVILTQIQLGDALVRVARLDASDSADGSGRPDDPTREDFEVRLDRLLRRADTGLEGASTVARSLVRVLEEWPEGVGTVGSEELEDLRRKVDRARTALRERRHSIERRKRHVENLRRVPRELVARLPNPQVVQGRQSWILVRHGRIFLLDREALFEEGKVAIGKILADAAGRSVRPDEFEAVSRYLRKRSVGADGFRWKLETRPAVRVELAWTSKEEGLEPVDLERDPTFRAWLSARSPDLDFITFHVWADSFEAYLAAREVI
ncbi:MAG TPA: hypothetical protein ENI85_00450, partial [Deltaproteobacteria bacterium]|nr:hypothetical protein [Deltaproteobacteria bacterium]